MKTTEKQIAFEAENKCSTVTYGEWSKHHKFIGELMKREYVNGEKETKIVDNAGIRKILERGDSKSIARRVVDSETYKTSEVLDSFVQFKNTEYVPVIEEYGGGANNTTSHLGLRYKFLLDDSVFWLDHQVSVAGVYPLISFVEDLEDHLQEIMMEDDLEKNGIEPNDEYGEGCRVYVVSNETGDTDYCDIEVSDLLDCFVGFEVYKAELVID